MEEAGHLTSDKVDDDDGTTAQSVWRFARASRTHVVVDAAASFDLMQDVFLEARQRIFLIGWDFDSRRRLGRGRRWWNLPRKGRFPARLGAFFVWLVHRDPDLQIRLLKWNFGALKFIFRGTMILDLVRWLLNPSIDFSAYRACWSSRAKVSSSGRSRSMSCSRRRAGMWAIDRPWLA